MIPSTDQIDLFGNYLGWIRILETTAVCNQMIIDR